MKIKLFVLAAIFGVSVLGNDIKIAWDWTVPPETPAFCFKIYSLTGPVTNKVATIKNTETNVTYQISGQITNTTSYYVLTNLILSGQKYWVVANDGWSDSEPSNTLLAPTNNATPPKKVRIFSTVQ